METLVKRNEAIYTCIKYKIVNYHALASLIRNDVEKITGRQASANSIVVAIKRFSDSVEKERALSLPPLATLRDARISVTNNIADVTIRPKKSELRSVLQSLIQISDKLDQPPDFFKSSNLIKLVADEKEYMSLIRGRLGKTEIEHEITGLTKLTLHLSPLAKKDPGFTLYISELLYSQGVTVIHSYVDEDTILIIDASDAPRAYEILMREIARSKQEEKQVVVRRSKKTVRSK